MISFQEILKNENKLLAEERVISSGKFFLMYWSKGNKNTCINLLFSSKDRDLITCRQLAAAHCLIDWSKNKNKYHEILENPSAIPFLNHNIFEKKGYYLKLMSMLFSEKNVSVMN